MHYYITFRYAINTTKWNSMSDEWRSKQFKSFMEDNKSIGKNEKTVKKNNYKGIAVKPCQRRRSISERTR